MFFPLSLSDSKFPQVSRTLLSILTDRKDAVVWNVSFVSFVSCSPNLSSKSLRTVTSAPTIIGITVASIFYWYFSSLARSKYVSIFSFSFTLTQWSNRTAKSTRQQLLLLLLLLLLMRASHIRVSWWSFTGVREKQVTSGPKDSSQYSGRY